jgi:hypothetical protein
MDSTKASHVPHRAYLDTVELQPIALVLAGECRRSPQWIIYGLLLSRNQVICTCISPSMKKKKKKKKKKVYQKYDYGHCTLSLQLVPRFSKVLSNW